MPSFSRVRQLTPGPLGRSAATIALGIAAAGALSTGVSAMQCYTLHYIDSDCLEYDENGTCTNYVFTPRIEVVCNLIAFNPEIWTPYAEVEQLIHLVDLSNWHSGTFGTTYEQRDLISINVSAHPQVSRDAVLITAGLAGNEYRGALSAVSFASTIATGYGNDARTTQLLDQIDLLVVPMANPDGYEFARLHDRGWVKNRAFNPGSSCLGVRLNRNWDFAWSAHPDPCSPAYGGINPFSAPEALAIRDMVASRPNIVAHINLVSAGGDVAGSPHGTVQYAGPASAGVAGASADMLHQIAESMAAAAWSGPNGDMAYEVGPLEDPTGSIVGWMTEVAGIPSFEVTVREFNEATQAEMVLALKSTLDTLMDWVVTQCAADLTGDHEVGFADLTALLSAWGPCDECPVDLNGDDEVGFADLTAMLSDWGACD